MVFITSGQIDLFFLSPSQLSNLALTQSDIGSAGNPWRMVFSGIGILISIILSILLAGKLIDKRTFQDFGLKINRNWWIDFCFGLGLGSSLILLIFIIELFAGWIVIEDFFFTTDLNTPFPIAIVIPLVYFIFVGIYEELLSRGYQLTNIAEGLNASFFNPGLAIILSTIFTSLIFAFLHTANPHSNLFSFINIFIAGVFLAYGYIYTGQLAIPIGLHISWNFFQGNVFGFPVSGLQSFSASFFKIQQAGPDIWTGGSFGPEGGILGILMLVIGMILIHFYLRLRNKHATLYLQLSEPPDNISNKLTIS